MNNMPYIKVINSSNNMWTENKVYYLGSYVHNILLISRL